MSVITPARPAPLTPAPAFSPDFFFKLSVDQYHAMIDAGILKSDDPVELLDGWLVQKRTKKPPHTLSTQLLRDALEQVVPEDWFVNAQEPITLATSEPEPDGSVIRGKRRDFSRRHPGPSEVGLVAEVSDTSLDWDRTFKKGIYAEAGIARYWIVNLIERQIEEYTQPSGSDYLQRRDYDAEIAVILEGREIGRIAVRDLLP